MYIFANGIYYFTNGASFITTGGYISNTQSGLPHYVGGQGATSLPPAADGTDNARLLGILRGQGFDVPDGSLPPSDPKLLLSLMDQQGMYAAITFGGLSWKSAKDPELLKAIYAAYNEFAFEMMAAAPERLTPEPAAHHRLFGPAAQFQWPVCLATDVLVCHLADPGTGRKATQANRFRQC